MTRIWSKYQQAVFEDVRSGTGNTAIEAVAGGAKSSTAIESLKFLPEKCSSVLVTSFATQSVDDLKAKAEASGAPWFIDIRTMNSLGNRAVTQAVGRQQISPGRVWGAMDVVLGDPPEDPIKRASINGFRARVKVLVDFAKNNLISGTDSLMELAEHYGLDTVPPEWMREPLSQKFSCPWEDALGAVADKVLDACKVITGRIDFNDQLWLPVVLDLDVEKFERIVTDESQDLAPVQHELLIRSMTKTSRLMMFGDDAQAIYTFRGAGAGMAPFIKRLNAKRLPLSISYRCPKAVVREAQKLVPHIQSHPDAPEGFVGSIANDMLGRKLVAGDTVLSRTNAPLVRRFMNCLRDGIPIGMQGRAIGESLLRFIDESKARFPEELVKFTDEWASGEIERRRKKNPNANVDKVVDHQECIEALCADTSSIQVVRQRIDQMLLAPTSERVLLSSTHRAKGLEWNRCYVLESTYPVRPSYWLNYASQKKGNVDAWCKKMAADVMERESEERHILYVAITRSRQELIYVR